MKKKILVVDDSPFMLTLINDILSGLNYEVTTVDNGSDACQMVESTRYDMIITDMNMPVMDGLELTKQIRAKPDCRFMPIVMLSSEENTEKISMAKKLGISTFISKPPKEGHLKTITQIILNKREAPRMSVKLEIFYGEDEKLSGYTDNMSVVGLFLETNKPLSPGEKLKLKFSLPGGNQPIICQGRVAWVSAPDSPPSNTHPPGMGVEFIDLEDECQITDFLRSVTWKD